MGDEVRVGRSAEALAPSVVEAAVAHALVHLLERAVLDELGVEAAFAGVVDFFVEETVERGTDVHPLLGGGDGEGGGLRLGCRQHQSCGKSKG